MERIEKLEEITKPFKNAVVTIGNFDGVHIGHRALLQEVIQKAVSIGGVSIAMTFEPHPIRVLRQNGLPPLLTPYAQKVGLLESTGIDVLICVPFDKAFAAITADAFVSDILVRRIGMKAIVTGKDYTFGRNREGNLELLIAYGKCLGFEVNVVDWIHGANTLPGRASSTKIRELISAGNVSKAEKLLGRLYQVSGRVIEGRRRGGKLLGFPTANIDPGEKLCPKTGIYAVTVEYGDRDFLGVANIGYSPTFKDKVFTVEVHILDFDEDIYGKEISVNFVRRLRDEIRFPSIAALSDQIRKDIVAAREILVRRQGASESRPAQSSSP
jgi:riboflavin kinase/FMN adenylyltransferase